MSDFPDRDPSDRGVEIYCPCSARFWADPSLKGGMTNCPECGKAVDVPGGPEGLFWFLLAVGVAAAAGIAYLAYLAGGLAAAGVAAGIGAAVIIVAVVAS